MFSRNDDVVNFSSPEYSSNRESKSKKTNQELKISLDMAKRQATAREVAPSPASQNITPIKSLPTWRDGKVKNQPDSTTVRPRCLNQPQEAASHATVCPRAPNHPLETASRPTVRPRSLNQPLEAANPSSPFHDETVRRGRQCSSSTVSDVDSENAHQSPMCSECKQRRSSLSCHHCLVYLCKRCSQNVHAETCPMAKQRECSQHLGKMLEYWCERDEKAICSDCGLLGSHKGHDISKLEERNEVAVREIVSILSKAGKVLETLVESKKAIEACPQDEMEKIHSKVTAYFKDRRDVLQKKEDVMHLQVEQTQQQLTLDCNSKASEIDEHIADLRSLLTNCNSCLKSKMNGPIIDDNGNIVDAHMLCDLLKKSSLLPCQFDLEEPSFRIDEDCLMLNYTKPNLQPISNDDLQAYLNMESRSDVKNQIKTEDNLEIFLSLKQNNQDMCRNRNQYKENDRINVYSKGADGDNGSSRFEESNIPVQIRRDLDSTDRTSLSKVSSIAKSNDAKFLLRIRECMEIDSRSVVLENVKLNTGSLLVSTWAEQWGNVEKVHNRKTPLRGMVIVIVFKTPVAAKACLSAGKWILNDTEINVKAPINSYTNSIYCHRLSKKFTPLEIEQHMKTFGRVKDVRISRRMSGDLFAIVDFSSEEERDLAVANQNHVINGWRFHVNAYGDRSRFCVGRKQSVDSKPRASLIVDALKTSETLMSLNNSQDREGPLSSSTPLERSITCEVGKASFKRVDEADMYRTQSEKIVPANIESKIESINSGDTQLNGRKTLDIIGPILETNRNNQFPDPNCDFENRSFSEDIKSDKDLEVDFYASPEHSKAQVTNDGWVRPAVPTNLSFEVKVTHIDSTGTVWVVPMKDLRAHRILSKILIDYCEDLISSPDSMIWKPGQRAVVFHEGLYERAEVVKVTTDRFVSEVTVILVDNGKSIECRDQQLLIAPSSGLPLTCPSLAMPVRLYGIFMNAPLDQTHLENIMGRVKHRMCTLALAWTLRSFPLSGSLRYTHSDCPEDLVQSGNMAEDLINLGCGRLVISFNDWLCDMSLCDLGWMTDKSIFPVENSRALPSTFPLRVGQWIPCAPVTIDTEFRTIGLHPIEYEYDHLDNSNCSVSPSILHNAVVGFRKRRAQYAALAESEEAHLFPMEGEHVLVFTCDEWCRARVEETTDEGPWVMADDYMFMVQVERKYVRKEPEDSHAGQYWHLDPVQVIRARWPLTGTETQAHIDNQKEMLLTSMEYFNVVAFDDDKREVVGHFCDKNKKRLF